MKKLNAFANKIIPTYTVVYLIIIHIIAISLVCMEEIDFTKNTADIILGIIGIIIGFIFADLCFLLPSAFVIASATLISVIMIIGLPVFLFLSLFHLFGSTIEVTEYGFFKTLIVLIIAMPTGIMNLKSVIYLFKD